MKINEDLMLIGLALQNREEVLEELGNRLYDEGYVKKDFVKGVIEREKTYPTGLPTTPYAIAIPHTDSDKVIKPAIAIATLRDTITFKEMGDAENEVDVKIIFMLAFNDPSLQLTTLQKLTGIFQNEEIVTKLGDMQNAEMISKLLASV